MIGEEKAVGKLADTFVILSVVGSSYFLYPPLYSDLKSDVDEWTIQGINIHTLIICEYNVRNSM